MKRKLSIKRVIACALAIMTAFTAIPFESVYASNTVTISDTITGTVDGTTLTISGTGEIPYLSYKLSTAGINSNNITDVIIEDGITSIGETAFSNWTALTNVSIPNTVNSIGVQAFNECTSLTTVNIPNSITTIGYGTFNGCSSLTEITLSNSLRKLERALFYECTSLTTVNIPESVTEIGDNVFYMCTSLSSITLPQNLTTIGNGAFNSCGLTEIIIPSSVTSIGSSALCLPNITEITIPEGITTLENGVLCGCSSLTTVNLPQSLNIIKKNAFEQCTSLREISIPNSVIEIGDHAFFYCSSLENINLSSNLTTLGNRVFTYCASLKEIVIPKSVVNTNAPFSNNNGTQESYLEKITFENGMVTIPANICKYASNITTVVIPDSIVEVGDQAFYNCDKLVTLDLPDTLSIIGNQAFRVNYTGTNLLTTINSASECVRNYNWYSDNRQRAFRVTFNSDGGSEIESQIIEDDGQVTEPEEPTKYGYKFIEWQLNGVAFDFANDTVVEDIELVAKWEPKDMYIEFQHPSIPGLLYGNGSWFVKYMTTLQDCDNISDDYLSPTVNGYEFLGWYYNNTKFELTTPVTENMVLVSKWRSLEYTVTFKIGNSVYETQSIENGQTAVRPTTDPTKENGRFIGWYTDETYTTEFNFNTPITADTEVYAYFKNQYTVEFWSSGEVVSKQTVEEGECLTEPEALEDLEMYSYNCRFLGWDYDFSQPVTSDIKIFAEWEAYCNITVYNNIDNSSYVVEAPYNGVIDANNIPSTPAPREGYTFVGYYKNISQNVLFDFNQTIERHTSITEVWKKSDIPAIVVNHYIHDEESNNSWGVNPTVDEWLQCLGSECYSETLNEKYTFDSLYSNNWKTTYLFQKETMHIELNLYKYMVLTKFDVNGNVVSQELIDVYQEDEYGNEILVYEVDFGEFGGRLDIYRATETKTVQFAGHDVIYINHNEENCNIDKCLCDSNFVNESNLDGYEEATGYEEYIGYRFTPCQHHTDFSHLDVLNYVDYQFIDGMPVYVNKITGQWESASSMPGYGRLIGWKTSKDATEMIDWSTVVFTDNTVLYPVIENYNCLKVTFVDSITNEVISEQYVNPYYGEGLTEPQRPTVPDGFTFIGWSATKSVNDLFSLSSRPTTDITLYSVYQKSYLVEFLVEKENGSFEQWSYQWIEENETATEPTNPIKEGYEFLGWYDGNTKFDFNTQITSGLSLIGKWKIKEFTINFVVNGQSIKNQTVEYGKTVNEIEAPVKDGFDFIGWFVGTEKYDFTSPVKQNITLEARYEEHVHNFNIKVDFKESTCFEKGYEVIKCSCGEQNRVDFELDFTNHVGETEVRNKKEATCTENGYTGDEYCKSCDRIIKAGKEIVATGHDTETVGKKEATCTTEGYTGDKICKNCKSVVEKGTKTEKAPHVGGDAVKENYVEPTTESKGSYDLVVYCENCETELSRKTEEIPMLEPTEPEDEDSEDEDPEDEPEDTEDEDPEDEPEDTEDEDPEDEPTEPESEEPEEDEPEDSESEDEDPETDDDPLYVEDTDEDTMSDIFGNFVEAVKTMAIVFSISLAAVIGVLGLLLLVLAWMKKVKVFNNTNTDMYSEDNYEVVLKTSVKTEGNKIAELFRKEDRVWTIIIPEETLNNRVSDSFKVELNKFLCKRYNGEQLIIRLGSDENSRQIGFVIDEAENVVTFTYED